MPLKERVGPRSIAFGGVVVDHVEDDFHAGFVDGADHGFEFAQAFFGIGGVARIGSEEADAVVAPIIGESLVE